jgi:hypothetical protein
MPFHSQPFCVHEAAQQGVHPTGGTLRVFRQFTWLEVDSAKMALSHPAHQRVTLAVGRLSLEDEKARESENHHQSNKPFVFSVDFDSVLRFQFRPNS